MNRESQRRLAVYWVEFCLVACTGNLNTNIEHGPDGNSDASTNDPTQQTNAPSIPQDPSEPLHKRWLDDTASMQPLRRLTAFQLQNAIEDLTGVRPAASALPTEGHRDGFVTFAALQITTVSDLRALQTMSAAVARDVDWSELADCSETTRACATQLIENFGRLAFRRPVREDEVSRYLSIYDAGVALSEEVAMRFVVQAILSSPSFHYREMGLKDSTAPIGYRAAEALALFVWASVPDAELLDQAASGALNTAQGRREAATRMLNDPRAQRAIADFHAQWLRLDQLPQLTPDPDVFPEYRDELAGAFAEQTLRYAQQVFADDGDFHSLLMGDFTFVNQDLAELYGLSISGDGFEKVPAENLRRGVLMQGATLARLSSLTRSQPIYRGDYILKHVLCREIELPGDLNVALPERDPQKSYREQLEEITGVGACNNCHSRINPLGFAIDNFDALGRYRPEENGATIDTSGTIVGIEDADGAFADGIEMLEQIADSEVAKECYAEKWYQYALGRARRETEDQAAFDTIMRVQAQNGYDLRSLLVEIAASDVFLPTP